MEQKLKSGSSVENNDDSSTIVEESVAVRQHNTNAMLPAVAWQEIGADDFAATSICKRYYFRAEQMDKKQWWWSVDCLSELIGDSWQSDIVAETKQQAFGLAERCYHAHLQSKQ